MAIIKVSTADSIHALFQHISSMEVKLDVDFIKIVDKIELLKPLEKIFKEIGSLQLMRKEEFQLLEENSESIRKYIQSESKYESIIVKCHQIYDTCQKTTFTEKERFFIKTCLTEVKTLLSSCAQGKMQQVVSHGHLEHYKTSKASKGNFSFCSMDILRYLFLFLSYEDLAHLALCSRYFNSVCDDKQIWTQILKKDFSTTRILENKHPKEIYIFQKSQEFFINSLKNNCYTSSVLKGHQGLVYCIRKDGNYLFSASYDKTIRVWDLTTKLCIAILKGHQDRVTCIEKQGNDLFSGSFDKTIKVWDVITKKCVKTLVGHQDRVTCIEKQGIHLFSGSWDRIIKIWDITKYECIANLAGHLNGVISLKVKENLLFSGSWDMTTKVWDLTVKQCIKTMKEDKNSILILQKEENPFFSESSKSFRQSDLTTFACIEIFGKYQASISCFQQEDNLVFVGFWDNNLISIWDLNKRAWITSLNPKQSGAFCLRKEGNFLITGDMNNDIHLWNLKPSLMDILINVAERIKDRHEFAETLFKTLPIWIRNKIYNEFDEILIFKKDCISCSVDVTHGHITAEKKIEAIYRYLLKEVIILFEKDESQKALELFNKLPTKIKTVIYLEFSKNNKFSYSYFKSIDKRLKQVEKFFLNFSSQKITNAKKIEAIKSFLNVRKQAENKNK